MAATPRVLAGQSEQGGGPMSYYENNIKGWGPELIRRRPDITMAMVDRFLTRMYRTNPDFVFTVPRDFVRTCQAPVLILPDDIPAHPYAVAMEAAMRACATFVAACLAGALVPHGTARAATELVILTNQGATPGVRALAAAFERASGHTVSVIQEEGEALERRIGSGAADLVTGTPPTIEALVKSGRVVAGTVTPFVLAELGLTDQ